MIRYRDTETGELFTRSEMMELFREYREEVGEAEAIPTFGAWLDEITRNGCMEEERSVAK